MKQTRKGLCDVREGWWEATIVEIYSCPIKSGTVIFQMSSMFKRHIAILDTKREPFQKFFVRGYQLVYVVQLVNQTINKINDLFMTLYETLFVLVACFHLSSSMLYLLETLISYFISLYLQS